MPPDSPLARVRKARHRISEECGHDPKRLVQYYMELQQRHRDRLVWFPALQPKQGVSDGESDDDQD